MPRISRCPPKALVSSAQALKVRLPEALANCGVHMIQASSRSTVMATPKTEAVFRHPPLHRHQSNKSSAKHRKSVIRSRECEVLELAVTLRSARDSRLHDAYNCQEAQQELYKPALTRSEGLHSPFCFSVANGSYKTLSLLFSLSCPLCIVPFSLILK